MLAWMVCFLPAGSTNLQVSSSTVADKRVWPLYLKYTSLMHILWPEFFSSILEASGYPVHTSLNCTSDALDRLQHPSQGKWHLYKKLSARDIWSDFSLCSCLVTLALWWAFKEAFTELDIKPTELHTYYNLLGHILEKPWQNKKLETWKFLSGLTRSRDDLEARVSLGEGRLEIPDLGLQNVETGHFLTRPSWV